MSLTEETKRASARDILTINDKWKVTTMELTVKGVVQGIDNSKFEEIAKTAEATCPISNALRNNVEIKLNAALTQ